MTHQLLRGGLSGLVFCRYRGGCRIGAIDIDFCHGGLRFCLERRWRILAMYVCSRLLQAAFFVAGGCVVAGAAVMGISRQKVPSSSIWFAVVLQRVASSTCGGSSWQPGFARHLLALVSSQRRWLATPIWLCSRRWLATAAIWFGMAASQATIWFSRLFFLAVNGCGLL